MSTSNTTTPVLSTTTYQPLHETRRSWIFSGLWTFPVLVAKNIGEGERDKPQVVRATAQAQVLSNSATSARQTLQLINDFLSALPLCPVKDSPPETFSEKCLPAVAAAPCPTGPKRGVTIQPSHMRRPAPPKSRRSTLNEEPVILRPASERLAEQDIEDEGDLVFVFEPEHEQSSSEPAFDFQFIQRIGSVRRLAVRRINTMRRAKSSDLRKLALNQTLAKRAVAPSPPKRPPRAAQVPRRVHPKITPLDMSAVRNFKSTNPPMDSPPESPGPVTPVDSTHASEEFTGKLKGGVPRRPFREPVVEHVF